MADSPEFHSENPITNWVFEIVPRHGDAVSRSDRLDQIEELVDRLEASTSLPVEESFDIAGETRRKHRRMVESAAFEGELREEEKEALIDAFDRVLTAWVASPTEISGELEEYRDELAAIRNRSATNC